MNKSKNNWLKLGLLAIVIIVIIVLVSLTGSNGPSNDSVATESASLALTSPSSATVEVGDLQHVRWTSENYAPSTVTVSVIRKVSDDPARYELVRTVAVATSNDGDAVWVPAKKDIGSNTLIQIGCAASAQGCSASRPTVTLAVIDSGRFANTANAFEAIEQSSN